MACSALCSDARFATRRNKFTKRCYLYDDYSDEESTYAYGVYAGYIECT